MRRSISNLALPDVSVNGMAPDLIEAGITGVELAPTVIWPGAPQVPAHDVRSYGLQWKEHGLEISGIQSLLYGHPEFQVFDRSVWPNMLTHLTAMIKLAHHLDTHIAVFGSPKNRVRGDTDLAQAHEICAEFLSALIPVLSDSGVVLALEPNAPDYGADYLTHYSDTIDLAQIIGSPWVQPQIDTGCLSMVGENPADDIRTRTPVHVHISAPHLVAPPGPINHNAVYRALTASEYNGWVVLEMLQTGPNPRDAALESARWLTASYPTEMQ